MDGIKPNARIYKFAVAYNKRTEYNIINPGYSVIVYVCVNRY